MKGFRAVSIVVLLVPAFLVAGWGVSPAWSDEKFPTRQLTYMVCFDPGGQSDREARRQQPVLEKEFGQNVVIDYKVGGGGALGWRELVKTKPDGYTFAGFNIPHVILQPLQQDVGYKTEQINPVFIFHSTPLALAVPLNSPYKTAKELIEFAKKNPGVVTIGGSGSFSGYHMAVLRLEKLTGTKITYVPFTGSAPQMTAFLGGHLTAIMAASDDVTRFRDKMKVLGFATEKPFFKFPEDPTLRSQGIDLVESVDRGVAVPPGTPPAVIKRIEAAFMANAKSKEFQEEQMKGGFIPLAMGHEEAKAYLKAKTAVYTELASEIKKK
ncbi:MAG: tripartite tricarboxylate transporter substrate binding protein [Thermodesulfobacteriota bacterium]